MMTSLFVVLQNLPVEDCYGIVKGSQSMASSKTFILFLKILLIVNFIISVSYSIAADPLEPYLSKTTYSGETSVLSSGCSYVDSNVTGLAEALSIDFRLDNGMLEIDSFELKDRRPLVGCNDVLEISLNAEGALTSALFSTSALTISGGDSTTYNLSAGFSELRKPMAETGKYLFDAIDYSVATTKACTDISKNASLVSPQTYFYEVRAMFEKAQNDSITQYIDNPSDDPTKKTKYGPVAHWFSEAALEYAGTAYLQQFDGVEIVADYETVSWAEYQKYFNALCNVYLEQDAKSALIIEAEVFLGKTGWSGHASKWRQFEYIDTGRKVIESPSPAGLEYYTKYTTGAGIIIVAGAKVDDDALLAARDAFIYMTSARPEMRGILRRSHARVSLFTENASELPEYGADMEGEIGGFAQGTSDANMTANATWLCYPGNWDAGGNPAIHELGHVINHLIFEETNETYWYDRITPLAYAARENGTYPADAPLGEYWAQAVEGYIMNKGTDFKEIFPTRAYIAANHPGLYQLLTRYLPTDEWDYCPGIDENK